MTAWRIIFAALAVVLAGAVVLDIAAEKQRQKRVLIYEKGTYLGRADTPLSEETRMEIRDRGTKTRAW